MGIANKLADNFTAYSVDLSRFSADVERDVTGFLKILELDLSQKIAEINPTEPFQLAYRENRLRVLLKEVQGSIGETYTGVKKEVRRKLVSLAALEGAAGRSLVNSAIGYDLMTTGLSPEMLKSLASNVVIDGAPSREWWSRQAGKTMNKFKDQIRMGMAQGESVDDIVRRVRGVSTGRRVAYKTLAGKRRYATKFTGGIMDTSTREAKALVRTSVQAVSQNARMELYKANDDLVKGLQALVTLDGRTSDICIARSGKVWGLDGSPQGGGGGEAFPGYPPWHWNCRSTIIPVLPEFEDLIDDKNISKEKREELKSNISKSTQSSMDGQVAEDLTYEQWLRTKPVEFQKEVLGATKFNLWNQGSLSLSKLLDQSGNPLSVAALTKKYQGVVKVPQMPVGKVMQEQRAAWMAFLKEDADNDVLDALRAISNTPDDLEDALDLDSIDFMEWKDNFLDFRGELENGEFFDFSVNPRNRVIRFGDFLFDEREYGNEYKIYAIRDFIDKVDSNFYKGVAINDDFIHSRNGSKIFKIENGVGFNPAEPEKNKKFFDDFRKFVYRGTKEDDFSEEIENKFLKLLDDAENGKGVLLKDFVDVAGLTEFERAETFYKVFDLAHEYKLNYISLSNKRAVKLFKKGLEELGDEGSWYLASYGDFPVNVNSEQFLFMNKIRKEYSTTYDFGRAMVPDIGDSGGEFLFSFDSREFEFRYESNRVDSYRRFFNYFENKVKHSEFVLDEEFQGKGIGKKFLGSAMKAYEKLGIESIGVDASLSRGGYAWLRYGFLPEIEIDMEDSIKLLEKKYKGIIPKAEFNTIRKLSNSSSPEDFWKIADMKFTAKNGELVEIGKELFSGMEWSGTLRLSNKKQMNRFWNYVDGDSKLKRSRDVWRKFTRGEADDKAIDGLRKIADSPEDLKSLLGADSVEFYVPSGKDKSTFKFNVEYDGSFYGLDILPKLGLFKFDEMEFIAGGASHNKKGVKMISNLLDKVDSKIYKGMIIDNKFLYNEDGSVLFNIERGVGFNPAETEKNKEFVKRMKHFINRGDGKDLDEIWKVPISRLLNDVDNGKPVLLKDFIDIGGVENENIARIHSQVATLVNDLEINYLPLSNNRAVRLFREGLDDIASNDLSWDLIDIIGIPSGDGLYFRSKLKNRFDSAGAFIRAMAPEDDIGKGDITLWHFGPKFYYSSDKIKKYERTFLFDGTVQHNLFEVNKAFQGEGIGKKFLSSAMKVYEDLDIKNISVDAGLNRGGYAWLRYGFLPDENEINTLKIQIGKDKIKELKKGAWKGKGISASFYKDLEDRVSKVKKVEDFWKIADLRYTTTKGEVINVGKDLFSGQSWRGGLDLSNKKQTIRFWNYVNTDESIKELRKGWRRVFKGKVVSDEIIDSLRGVALTPNLFRGKVSKETFEKLVKNPKIYKEVIEEATTPKIDPPKLEAVGLFKEQKKELIKNYPKLAAGLSDLKDKLVMENMEHNFGVVSLRLGEEASDGITKFSFDMNTKTLRFDSFEMEGVAKDKVSQHIKFVENAMDKLSGAGGGTLDMRISRVGFRSDVSEWLEYGFNPKKKQTLFMSIDGSYTRRIFFTRESDWKELEDDFKGLSSVIKNLDEAYDEDRYEDLMDIVEKNFNLKQRIAFWGRFNVDELSLPMTNKQGVELFKRGYLKQFMDKEEVSLRVGVKLSSGEVSGYASGLNSTQISELEDYAGSGYERYQVIKRGLLFNGSEEGLNNYRKSIEVIDDAFNYSVMTEPDELYQFGIRRPGRLWTNAKVGDVVEDKGYFSTTREITDTVAQRFANHGDIDNPPFLVKVKVKKGTRAIEMTYDVGSYEDEAETLLPAGSKFFIRSIRDEDPTNYGLSGYRIGDEELKIRVFEVDLIDGEFDIDVLKDNLFGFRSLYGLGETSKEVKTKFGFDSFSMSSIGNDKYKMVGKKGKNEFEFFLDNKKKEFYDVGLSIDHGELQSDKLLFQLNSIEKILDNVDSNKINKIKFTPLDSQRNISLSNFLLNSGGELESGEFIKDSFEYGVGKYKFSKKTLKKFDEVLKKDKLIFDDFMDVGGLSDLDKGMLEAIFTANQLEGVNLSNKKAVSILKKKLNKIRNKNRVGWEFSEFEIKNVSDEKWVDTYIAKQKIEKEFESLSDFAKQMAPDYKVGDDISIRYFAGGMEMKYTSKKMESYKRVFNFKEGKVDHELFRC